MPVDTPWMNVEALKAVRRKRTRWKNYLYCRNDLTRHSYTQAKYYATKIVKDAKRKYEKKTEADLKTNPKKFWKLVTSKTKVQEKIPTLRDTNGHIVTRKE